MRVTQHLQNTSLTFTFTAQARRAEGSRILAPARAARSIPGPAPPTAWTAAAPRCGQRTGHRGRSEASHCVSGSSRSARPVRHKSEHSSPRASPPGIKKAHSKGKEAHSKGKEAHSMGKEALYSRRSQNGRHVLMIATSHDSREALPTAGAAHYGRIFPRVAAFAGAEHIAARRVTNQAACGTACVPGSVPAVAVSSRPRPRPIVQLRDYRVNRRQFVSPPRRTRDHPFNLASIGRRRLRRRWLRRRLRRRRLQAALVRLRTVRAQAAAGVSD